MRTNFLAYSLLFIIFLNGCSDNKDDKESIDPNSLNSPLINSEFIDKKIAALLADYQIPGMAIAVVSNTKETKSWNNSYGMSKLETKVAIDENTAFWLGSLSKHIMGLSLMIARDQGLIGLDGDVRSLLETNAGFSIAHPSDDPITFRHLMSQSSGIIDSDAYECAYFINLGDGSQELLINSVEEEEVCPDSGPTTLSAYLQAYLDANGVYYSEEENFLSVAPGTESNYSNIGSALAGYALELATGLTLAEFAQNELFTPLDMNNTSWDSTTLNTDNIATPYYYDDADSEVFALPKYELATWPDGGLRSSVSDITKLLVTLINDGIVSSTGQQLISSASLDEMQTLVADDYGLFTEIINEFEYAGQDHILIGHTGSDPGAFSFMLFDKEKDVGIVIVSNGDDESVDEELLGGEIVDLIKTLFEAGELMGK